MSDKDFSLGLDSSIEKLELVSNKLNEICRLINELKELGCEIDDDSIDVNIDKVIDF